MKATKTWVFIVLLLIPAINVHAWPIPDTGQTKCYDNDVEITCPTPGQTFYGQDGNYILNPLSYTKMAANGAALPNSATTWAMVKDNVTGLIWEKKTNDGGIHDKDNTYTWCHTNPATNGGDEGTCGTGTGDAATDTEAFIKALNDARFGGFSDWRLPTLQELQSIVDYSRWNPAIDTTFFPGTMPDWYWSSTTATGFTKTWAWEVDFGGINDGISYYDAKSSSNYVSAVRAAKSVSLDHFVDNGDGTVTDTATGLMWQQGTSSSTRRWDEALTYAEGLSLAGYDDWRLPTLKELQSIVDYSREDPAIDTTFFPGTFSDWYWSSTTAAFSTSNAWNVIFEYGWNWKIWKDVSAYYVRAVRTGPWIHLTPATLDFGTVRKGTGKELTLTVKNIGLGTLIGNATTIAPFSIVSGGSYSLGPNQSQVVTIQYLPTTPGTHTSAVVFTGGSGATVPVTGKSPAGLPWLLLLLGD